MEVMLRSSFSVGRFMGVDLRIHISFPVLLALAIGYSIAATGSPVRGFALWLALVFAVAVRETARVLVAAYTGLHLRALFLLPVGGVMAMAPREDGGVGSPRAVVLAAPLANFGVGLLLLGISYAIDPHVPLLAQPWISIGHILRSFVWTQFVMGAVNLLPTAALPSPQMLRSRSAQTNAQISDQTSAQTGAKTAQTPRLRRPSFGLGTMLAFAMLVAGIALMNVWIVLFGCFALLGAQIQSRQTLDSNDETILVREVMLTEFTLLSSSDTLQGALDRTTHSLQDVFPVVRGDRLVGSVSRQTIADHLQATGDSYLQGVMTRSLQLAAPAEKLVIALRRAGSQGASEFIPVVEDGAMLGILTPQSLARAVQQIKLTRPAREAQERS
ncbi:CBS domain-containing protein [Granulicella sp. S156]|jgi:predicted transcriptional regulator|uniref:CBS domain-containing protein n=1 Tax=Granulicella sp. S156 TaxID=1747224 RepID=UPI00131B9BBF|nr:CBS domain-containing protein [Granulicella sp. S156]